MSQESTVATTSIMEKKNFTPPSKKLDVCRSRQDGTGPGQLERTSRSKQNRHDAPINFSNPRSESSLRNTAAQKSKVIEKKSRPREPNTSQPSNVDSSDEPEIGSVQAPGSRKQNISQLLHLFFAPRSDRSRIKQQANYGDTLRHGAGGPARPKFNKEHFLQSRCQFLVNKAGDYTVYNLDPDLLVDWNLIEQISVRVTDEQPLCPICLSIPVAAKITKCGHIYCSPCLLHYFALSHHKIRNCPTCYDNIEKDDIKSVVTKVCEVVKVGDKVEMQLMFRPKDSLQVHKFGGDMKENIDSIFSKLIAISSDEVNDVVVHRELTELRVLLEEIREMPESCFVDEAIGYVVLRHAKNSRDKGTSNLKVSNQYEGNRVTECHDKTKQNATVNDSINPDVLFQKLRIDNAGNCAEDDAFSPDKSYYFYQATDGQNVFLHPLNVAMVRQEFGFDPAMWPATITCSVIEIEEANMSEELRKRLKVVSHIPLTSVIQLVELDLKSLISESVGIFFWEQLDARHRRRVTRERSERKKERMLEEAERKKHWIPPAPKIQSKIDFPNCGSMRGCVNQDDLDFHAALLASVASDGINDSFGSSHEEAVKPSSSSTIKNSASVDSDYPGLSGNECSTSASSLSFAQAAASGNLWKLNPRFQCTRAQETSSKVSTPGTDEAEDDYTAPDFRSSVSDAIAKAFATMREHDGQDSTAGTTGNPNGAQKKKGRKKGKVLFATGVGFGSHGGGN